MHLRLIALALLFPLVLSGNVGGVYAQENSPVITRAGAVAVFVESNPDMRARAAWYDTHMPQLPLFYDVDRAEWYAPYLEAAFEYGLITGAFSEPFRPGGLLKTEEAITLANRMKRITNPGIALPAPKRYGSWYSEQISIAAVLGVTLPAKIRIGGPVARSEFHAMVQSLGITNPQAIALSVRPQPHAVPPGIAVAPVPRPVTAGRPAAQSRPVQQTRPQQVAVTRNEDTPTSAKYFAISMPSLGIHDLAITHPKDPFTSQGLLAPLKYGVGHLFSYPGKGGKILVYGHSSSYPWDISSYTKIFRQINKLGVGDKVYVNYGGSTHAYEVTYTHTVPAKDMSAYRGGSSEELILYTCWPPDSISQRYLVHAKRVEEIAKK